MFSRYAAARPKRAGESFARAHHGEQRAGGSGDNHDGPSSSKRVKFDVRNPSALAPDSRDDDEAEAEDVAVLDADVIGKGPGATKRGAVNIDGYDSDSENETFDDRAERRGARGANGGGDVDIADKLDNYDRNLRNGGAVGEGDGDEGEDMFAADDDDPDEQDINDPAAPQTTSRGKKGKEVRFLDEHKIEGQESTSKSGGHIHLDEQNASSDDEEDVELAIQEEGVDEEIGMGGLKRNAPKIDAFNMKNEQEEGAFDEAGNFIRKTVDPDAVHDRWLEGVSKKEMKKAREAHEKREAELRAARKEDDSLLTQDLLRLLILHLERGETPIEALARLGRARKSDQKKVPKWKLKKLKDRERKECGGADDAMHVDPGKEPEDPAQARVKEAINVITEAADKLLAREYAEVYETERELLVREWQDEAGERWREPTPAAEATAGGTAGGSAGAGKVWEYRWTDGRDGGSVQGPYDGPTMKAWQDAGYFEGVEFRAVGEDTWDRLAEFV
ncbi:putative lin1 family protein [Diaporthe ampelina]|uniref:Putative lin1 family protein n=1 Tax=Diaporthe ampelina TaxID=1214573 RepID=A0A0G2HR08_9PEZI|nr:putative lin1 family protein [Diaporthe ampelina]